jgi:hypothetical protein
MAKAGERGQQRSLFMERSFLLGKAEVGAA